MAGQITLTWSGGLGNNVKYSYALSNNTNPIASIGAITGNGVGTPYYVTLTLTTTNSVTTTVTLTTTVLGGSTSAVSNSITPVSPATVSISSISYGGTTVPSNSYSGALGTTNGIVAGTASTYNVYAFGKSNTLGSSTNNYIISYTCYTACVINILAVGGGGLVVVLVVEVVVVVVFTQEEPQSVRVRELLL